MKHSFLFLISLITLTSLAQSTPRGSIRGTVVTADGQPAAFVNVILKGTNRGSSTDEGGQFVVKNVPAGPQTLRISLIGYQPEEQTVAVRHKIRDKP